MPEVVTSGVMRDLELIKQGSYSQVSGDVLKHVLYDTLRFAAATVRATTTFFSQQIGQAYGDGVKSKVETNLQDSGKLPAGQGFLIKGISFALRANMLGTELDTNEIFSDFTTLIQNSTFEIRIAGREFDFQFPGTKFLPSIFLGARATVVDATDETFRVGQIMGNGHLKLETPIIIGEMVSFNVTQITGNADTSVQTILNNASNRLATQEAELQIRLDGTLVRSK